MPPRAHNALPSDRPACRASRQEPRGWRRPVHRLHGKCADAVTLGRSCARPIYGRLPTSVRARSFSRISIRVFNRHDQTPGSSSPADPDRHVVSRSENERDADDLSSVLEVSPAPGPVVAFARRLEPRMRDVVGQETTGTAPRPTTPAETRAFEQLLATKTFAVKDAPTANGRFPVVIYHPGTSGTYEDNSVLFEYLASHGYIVLSSAYPDPDASGVLIGGDMAGSFADLDFLVTFARTLPSADADRLGVMGHSYGAWVSFAWAAKKILLSAR